MDWLPVVILAVVQGITEFLPISSDGHLVVTQALLERCHGTPLAGGMQLEIVLHAGTLAAILVVFRQRVWRLLGEDRRVLGLLVVGTLPAVIVGLPLRFYCEDLLMSPLLAGLMLPITGLLLVWAARRPMGETAYQNLTYGRAFWIGVCQATALLPGISRSGTTISAGLALGLKRDAAATFSFLLALPAVGGACALELIKALTTNEPSPWPWPLLLLGVVVSGVVGVLALTWLLKWLENGRLQWFAWWCIPLGVAIVVWQLGAPGPTLKAQAGEPPPSSTPPQDSPMNEHYEQLPLPAAAAEAGVKTATSLTLTEGPACDAEGNVYFSDIAGNRIWKLAPDGTRTVFREPSGRTNGNTFDQEGRLLHCEGAETGPGGGRRVTRTNLATEKYEVLTERYEGLRYNSPNDICVDGRGRIYFTDPRYGDRSDLEMQVEGVYRIDSDGGVTRILEQPAIQRPNGIAVTQDCQRMYLIDSANVVGGNRKIWAFDLDDAGTPSNQRLIYDFGAGRGGDGMRLDIEGNLYVAAGIITPRGPHESTDVPPGIYLLTPAGKLTGRIPIPEDLLTNVAFGGPDGRTLYITAGKTIFTTRVAVPGQVAWPKWKQE